MGWAVLMDGMWGPDEAMPMRADAPHARLGNAVPGASRRGGGRDGWP